MLTWFDHLDCRACTCSPIHSFGNYGNYVHTYIYVVATNETKNIHTRLDVSVFALYKYAHADFHMFADHAHKVKAEWK